MGTAGNPLTSSGYSGSVGNALTELDIATEEITDPTLGNGDGTYSLTVSNARQIDSDEVLGVEWDGNPQRARLDSVADSTVVVIFEEPDGGGALQDTPDGNLTGTLKVRVLT